MIEEVKHMVDNNVTDPKNEDNAVVDRQTAETATETSTETKAETATETQVETKPETSSEPTAEPQVETAASPSEPSTSPLFLPRLLFFLLLLPAILLICFFWGCNLISILTAFSAFFILFYVGGNYCFPLILSWDYLPIDPIIAPYFEQFKQLAPEWKALICLLTALLAAALSCTFFNIAQIIGQKIKDKWYSLSR